MLRKPPLGSARRASQWLSHAAAMMLVVAGRAASAGPPPPCDLRLTVTLTPDVAAPRDPGFLSSLLGDFPGYSLILRDQAGSSVLDVELTGPGPAARCVDVVTAMRRSGDVSSVVVQAAAQR